MTETETTTVKEITCPECERIWPRISEQGIVTDMVGHCYKCFIDKVVVQRNSLEETADYSIQNCGECGGLPGKVEKCVACGGKGWETVPKGKEALPKIVYPY